MVAVYIHVSRGESTQFFEIDTIIKRVDSQVKTTFELW
jgi:hypothetical protein